MDFNQCIKDDTLVLTYTAVNVSELVSFLQNNTYITKLSLSGLRHRISHEDVRELAKLTNLTSLNLSHNNISDEGAKELAKLTNLTSLVLSENKIGDKGAKELAKLANLTSLHLYRSNIGDKGAKELAKLTKLTSLILSGNKIGNEGAKELAKLTNLTELNLNFNNVDYEGAKELAKLINLTELDLSGNKIGDKGAKELAWSQYLEDLKTLNLGGNRISDEGAKALAESLYLANLTQLDLSGNCVSYEGAKGLAKSHHLKNLEWVSLGGNEVYGESVEALARCQYSRTRPKFHLGGAHAFYNCLLEVYSNNQVINEERMKDVVFSMIKGDYRTMRYILTQPDKYPFLINSQSSRHTLFFYCSDDFRMRKFLFERGTVPEQEKDGALQRIAQDNQSTHMTSAVKKTNFFAKKLVESVKVDKEQLKQAVASHAENMPELLKQYQGDPIRLGLLSLTDNEKRSVMERTLPYDSSTPNDKEFIKIVINTARLALRDKYLRRSYHRYGQGYSTARIQYDYTRDNAKITIPESIGYIKLLIDNFSIPPGEKKELLVTLMEQNPELVKGKLPIVKKELGDSDIFDNEKFDRAELHKLLDSIDSDKVGNLFKEISGLDIEKVWREQKEFVLLKQIYMAATTYGESNSACTQGIWSQVISSLDEIDSKLMDQYEQYLDEEREQERQRDTISRGNIAQFTEDLARKLIQYTANNPEIKEALEDFALAMVNVEEPQKITLKQQKIIAQINQEFSENIKKFLPNYSKDIPTGDEYQIIIGELLKTKIMQDFAKAQAEVQEVNDEMNQSTLLSNVDVSQGASKDYYI